MYLVGFSPNVNNNLFIKLVLQPDSEIASSKKQVLLKGNIQSTLDNTSHAHINVKNWTSVILE